MSTPKCTHKDTYQSNKSNYKILKTINHIITLFGDNEQSMVGGSGSGHNNNIIKHIDELANTDIKNTKAINLDLYGLQMRVYERDGTNINEIMFIPPNVLKYLNDLNSFEYSDYYEKKYGNILNNELSNVELNFNTNKSKVRAAFYDNYGKGNKTTFEISLPIKLVDFINHLFDHFDQVHLRGYPDNGGIDGIVYDSKNDVYLVQTWS